MGIESKPSLPYRWVRHLPNRFVLTHLFPASSRLDWKDWHRLSTKKEGRGEVVKRNAPNIGTERILQISISVEAIWLTWIPLLFILILGWTGYTCFGWLAVEGSDWGVVESGLTRPSQV